MLQKICVIENEGNGPSYFSERDYDLTQHGGMWISAQQPALNFRHRKSHPGYKASWHVAGDPTLIIILRGTLRIGLRNGECKDFSAGSQFIAADDLGNDIPFDDSCHGHTAEVLGDETLEAVHIKLTKRVG